MTTNKKSEQLRQEYLARINRVIDYIENNLDADLSLQKLAKIANFSPYHFHRIFSSLVGETLNNFIQRIRLEKAASLLKDNPAKSITEIAFDCGFSGSAPFARAFKEKYGLSASQWRNKEQESKICQMPSKNDQLPGKIWQDFQQKNFYFDDLTNNQIWRFQMGTIKDVQIEVKDLPELNVAYVRHIGPYQGNYQLFAELYAKLCKWAGPRGLINFPESKFLTIYHDDPDITEEEKQRISVCLTISAETKVSGEIGKMKIAGGKYAVAHFEINSDQFSDAWQLICGKWLPESGYQPDDKPAYEINLNDPKEHPEHKHLIEICVPVRPL